MIRYKTFLLGLAVCAAFGDAGAQGLDARTVPADDVREQAAATAPLRRSKPRLAGPYRVASRLAKAPVQRKAASATPLLYADIIDCGPNGEGIYTLSTQAYGFTPVKVDDGLVGEYGAAYHDGRFYAVDLSKKAYVWDTDSWTMTAGPLASELIAGTAMAVDPRNGDLYSCAYDIFGRNPELVVVDTDGFTRRRTVGAMDRFVVAMCFDNQGRLLGLARNGKLYEISTSTGESTLLGDTGAESNFGGGMVVDPASGACFLAVNDWTCALYELDLTTYEASLLYEFEDDECVQSLFILPPAPEAGAPAAVTDFAAIFADGALSGSLEFTAPTVTYSGVQGSGTLGYSVVCNDTQVASGICSWGQKVTLPYTATAAGSYAFSLTLSTDAGEGRPATTALWIGPDTPQGVTGLSFTRSGQNNVITWNAPSGSAHGGYVNLNAITYNVKRLPDNVTVATGLTATEYTDPLPDTAMPVAYSYQVTAHAGDLVSETVATPEVMVGALYHNDFATAGKFAELRSLTLVNEGPVWRHDAYNQCASVTYNEDAAVSAWLTTPALTLEAGKTYVLEFQAWCSNSDYTEKMSVYIGSTDDIQAVYASSPVLGPIAITNQRDAKRTVSLEYTPEAAGEHYITFLGCSPRDQGTLFMDDILFYRKPSTALPMAPAISAEITSGRSVSITVTAPTKDTEGDDLQAIETLTVTRGETPVGSVANPEPGSVHSFTDLLPADDVYTYTAVAYTANGPSQAATASVTSVPAARPRAPHGVHAAEEGNTGRVTLTWETPATDVNNRPLIPAGLTYSVYAQGSQEPLATGLTECSYTWQAVPEGRQQFMQFTVTATNEAGEGQPSNATVPAAFGTPLSLPFAESFARMELSTPWSFYNDDDFSYGQWLIVGSSEAPLAQPFDFDGGMMGFYGETLGDTAWATTGKIDLGDDASPRLSFHYFAVNAKAGKDQLDVLVDDGTGFRLLDSFTPRDAQVDGWMPRNIDLSAYACKVVQIRFQGQSFRTDNLLLIDKIEITNAVEDLAAQTIAAPSIVETGVPFRVEAVVKNNSSKAIADYSVVLYRNGAEVASRKGENVEGGSATVVVFDQTADAAWESDNTYHFVINYVADKLQDNNRSETVNVTVNHNDYPAVQEISARYTDQTLSAVTLAWSAPDRRNLPVVQFTENFEFLTPFDINPACDWTFIDADGDNTYGSQLFPYPGQNDPKAYIVFNSDYFNVSYAAHSGNQYLAAIDSSSKQNDDWMISPELTGAQQQISFWARSYSDTYGLEAFEVQTSAGGTDMADFQLLESCTDVPVDWTLYTFTLPEGTRRFAIRCVSRQVFALFIDDVTYTPSVNPAANFGILGYNVYRNSQRINAEPLNALTFTDYALHAGEPRYAVSVVYDHGESPMSRLVTPEASGIDGATVSTVEVTAEAAGIRIIGAHGPVAVHTPDGRLVFSARADGPLFVPCAPGLYLVIAGDSTVKVIVR